ncbi:hypothetical protein [Peredibacter starrii]|uniref:Prealbumin-like fold domain-containing protein n=1 Tax=Peredibacter starrii TaxID=28202 RepID=A0AAX4HS82_9BACT|nr:hypothetical protein [Peredibacter starrii]WPU65911.1 hypothetical protein SOO65_04050 [Peredibacter starrii]
MRLFTLLAFSFIVSTAQAQSISCTAQVFESFPDGSTRQERKELTVETENPVHISLSTDLDGRGFTLSGNKEYGPYFISITEEPDYTKGSLSTAEFSKDGRLQISIVDGRLVHKLECFKKN